MKNLKEIKLAKIQAKWEEHKRRQLLVEKRIDYYNNNQKKHVSNKIEEMFSDHDAKTTIKKFIKTDPDTRKMIDETNILFDEDMKIEIENEAIQDKINEILQECSFDKYCENAYKTNKLTLEPVGVLCRWLTTEKIDLTLLTADKYFIVQNEESPKEIDALYYQINQQDSVTIADKIETYIKWTNDFQEIVRFDTTNFSEETIEKIPNKLGKIPIAWFTHRVNDKFFFDEGQPIVESNEMLNIERTVLRLGMLLQGWGKFVITNADPAMFRNINAFMTSHLVIPPADNMEKPEASFVNSSTNLNQNNDVIKSWESKAQSDAGLNPDLYQGKSSFSSGYQLKLAKMQPILQAKKDKKNYRKPVKDLAEIIMDMTTLNNNSVSFPKDIEIVVDFGEPKIDASQEETARADAVSLANGTISVAEILLRNNPDLKTIENAQKEALEIKKMETERFGGSDDNDMGLLFGKTKKETDKTSDKTKTESK